MATLTSNNFQSKNLLDTFYIKTLGRRNGIILSKLGHLVGEKENVRISIDHLINSVGGAWKDRSVKACIRDLKDLGLIDKIVGYVRDAQGRIISSYIDFTMKWEKIRKLIFPDGEPISTEVQNLPTPSAVPSSFSKEKENNVHKSTFRFFSTKVKEQPVASSLPKTRIELKKDKPISKSWYRKAWEVGIHTDQIEKIHPEFIKYHTETKPSRRTAKQWTLAWIRWIANNITYSKEEKMPKLKKEVIDPYKIESEMRYEIYNEKSETIKTLRFKILELATPSTYKAWFKDIIFETCFNDDNYDYAFIPRSNFIKDKFDTDPKLNGILKAFKIKMAA